MLDSKDWGTGLKAMVVSNLQELTIKSLKHIEEAHGRVKI